MNFLSEGNLIKVLSLVLSEIHSYGCATELISNEIFEAVSRILL